MNNEKTKFQHKGIDIEVTSSGEFLAKVGGTEIKAPSIAAMKKKLDRVDPFEPFKAFSLDWRNDSTVFNVVGVVKHRRYNQYNWRTDNGYSHNTVYAATPTNLAIAKKLKKAREDKEKAEKRYDEIIEELRDQLIEAPYPGKVDRE